MNILVTGSEGFLGKNLLVWLEQIPAVRVLGFDERNTTDELHELLGRSDLVYHLAGVNRPQEVEEFQRGNVELTGQICEVLLSHERATPIVFSSSIQADHDNPYGTSKREAEAVLADYAARSAAPVAVFRLPNVFGKWCRPNYNSVVATFCHSIARDLPITISDPRKEVPLVHVDDVVRAFLEVGETIGGLPLDGKSWPEECQVRLSSGELSRTPGSTAPSLSYFGVHPQYTVALGRLAEIIREFKTSRESLLIPDFGDSFVQKLYGTYLSYLETGDFAYGLLKREDPRGSLAEFMKSGTFGQVFVSRTKPGITRGNHYHHTKSEKFLVLEGEALIRFRHIHGGDVIEYRVSGGDFTVVDIPPGYTHSIENTGSGDLITLFWASEMFDPIQPDTFYKEV